MYQELQVPSYKHLA